jgi:ATP-independent RNA helicase DbpA
MVINVELARDSEIHIHRVGRTGRAGEKGWRSAWWRRPKRTAPKPSSSCRKPAELGPGGQPEVPGRRPLLPQMSTLCIGAGRKDKVRPGDILGALTGDAGIPGPGGQDRHLRLPGVCGRGAQRRQAGLQRLNDGKIKGRSLRVRIL